MARSRPRGSGQSARNQQEADERDEWWASADSHVGGAAAWDINRDEFVRVVLALISSGRGVGLYSSWGGDALTFRIYDGDRKHDKRIKDSFEFDELIAQVMRRLLKEGVIPPDV